MSDRAVHPLQAFSAADAAKGAASAPGDVEADGSGARPAPVSCCCLCCRRTTFRGAPLTRRLRRRLLLASLLAVALCVAGAALGLYYGVFLKSTKTTPLRVTKMPTGPGAALGRRRRRLASVPGAAVASSTATAYAQARAFGPLDQLILNVAEVRFAPVSGGGTNLISTDWVAKQLVLAPGLNSVPIDSSVAGLVDGPYLAADFVFWNAWTIQAFCQTANAFLYTTPAGVVSRPSAPAAMPPDYGPLEYDFMAGFGFVSTRGSDSAANSAAQGHQSFINSAVAYTVGNGTAVQLLVDPSHVVSCYDGTAAAGDHAGLLPPFGFDQRVGQATPVLPFAWAAPAFSLQNWLLPVFVDVSSSPGGGAAATVGETYAFAASPAALPAAGGAPVDWSALVIASATWGGAGAAGAPLLDMRVRGSGGGWSAPSLGFASSGPLFNFTQAAGGGGGSWGAFNGPQYPGSYEMMRARVLSGFARPAAGDYTTVGSASVADGPECGAATGTQGGEVRYGTCLNGTVTIYYVQLQRGT